MKRIFALIASAAAALTAFAGLGAGASAQEEKGVVILHTNDVHCGFYADDDTFGAADLAAYKARLESEGYAVILADAGDFVQGGIIGTLSDGAYPMEIMNALGYDVAIPGNHEFDYGMDNFFALTEQAQFPYISANFTDLRTDEKPLEGYALIEAGGMTIGFVGVTTPETPISGRPSNFQDEDGEMIYGFCGGGDGSALYSAVQQAVDGALADGAERIVVLGHMGDYVYDDRWSSAALIENVSGIDVFVDGHSHSVIDGAQVTDKDGESVLLVSTGTKLANIGEITFTEDGIETQLIDKTEFTPSADESTPEYAAYAKITQKLADIEQEYSALVETVVADAPCDLTVNDPDTGERAVRNAETNLGDLCADAYRIKTGADVGLINGGGVRASIAAGGMTYGDIIEVQPFGNSLCVLEVTGRQLLDCLEMGARYYPEENGAFMQVSGLTYEIHSYISSSVTTDEGGNFTGVSGEYRVKNVIVGGEPLDPERVYTVASHDYMLLTCGDGMSMFSGCNIVAREIMLDNQALIGYLTEELGGTVGAEYSDPRGSGRIAVVTQPESEPAEAVKGSPDTGAQGAAVFVGVLAAAAVIAAMARRKA